MLIKTTTTFAILISLAAAPAFAAPADKLSRLDKRLTHAEASGRIKQGTRADRYEDRIDRFEDRVDRREDYRDRQVDNGRRDRIEDRFDARENRLDRAENRIDRRR